MGAPPEPVEQYAPGLFLLPSLREHCLNTADTSA